jgi:transposase InsO family protein
LDRFNRQVKANRPNALCVWDFTDIWTWQGWLLVAWVMDVDALGVVGPPKLRQTTGGNSSNVARLPAQLR